MSRGRAPPAPLSEALIPMHSECRHAWIYTSVSMSDNIILLGYATCITINVMLNKNTWGVKKAQGQSEATMQTGF